MERVQYHLERSLPQLQLLDDNAIFTKEQLHSITSQRQAHEARLIRRAPQKVDFLRYADFEQSLSDLIVTKAVRMDLGRHFTQQNYALHTGHIVSIWERLVRRFKWDVDSWQRYIQWANKRKMRVVVGRLYARALSLHPNNIPLWLSAASHELNSNLSTTAARSLLQRALRQNALSWKTREAAAVAAAGLKRKNGTDPTDDAGKKLRTGDDSSALAQSSTSAALSGPLKLKLSARETDLLRLWIEYFRMELVFIERLRRRWIVLGIQWEGDEQDAAVRSADDPEVSAVAQTLQDETEAEEGDADENERVLLSQVPEKEEGVELDADATPSRTYSSSSNAKKPNTYTQRGAIEIPAAQLSILRGSIPVFLISNALSTLPPSLHFVFLLALLELFRNFPLADSAGGAISGQQASNSKKEVQAHATRSGETLRMRLIGAVYDVLADRERWSWRYYAPVATLVATRAFRDPIEKLLSVEEEMEAEAEAVAELRDGERLAKASTLRTTFSEDSDALLDLAEWIRMGGGNRSASSSSSMALRLTLQLLEAALVDPVAEGGDEKTEPSLLSLRLARSGLVPQAVQHLVETMRPLCVAAPLPASASSVLSSYNAKSDFYTAATLLLNLLSNTSRSAIDEANLLKYIDAVRTEMIAEARKAGHGVESGQMHASILRRKYGALAVTDAVSPAPSSKKLSKAIKEVEEATAPASKGGFPGNEDLWRLRIELKLALLQSEPEATVDAKTKRQKMSTEWTKGLLVCSNAELDQDSTADGEEGSDDASAFQGGLWNAYLDWIQGEVHQIATAGGVKEGKAVKKAAKWMHAEYETAIRTTSSLLSRSTVSTVRASSNLSMLQAKKQATHDLVLKRYVSLCSEIDSRSTRSKGKRTNLDCSIDHILSSSFGSENFYAFLIDHLISLRSSLVVVGEEEMSNEAARLDDRITSLYIRSLDLLTSRLSTSARRSNDDKEAGAKLAETWIRYLSFLVEVKKEEMGTVLKVLESGKRSCTSAFGDERAAGEVRRLEKGWSEVCERLSNSVVASVEEDEEEM